MATVVEPKESNYVEIIVVDDRSVSPNPKSRNSRWVPEEEWAPEFRSFQKSLREAVPFVRVWLFRPNKPNSDSDLRRLRFLLSEIQSPWDHASTRPVAFIAHGSCADLVGNAILFNKTVPKRFCLFSSVHSSMLALGSSCEDGSDISALTETQKEKLRGDLLSYEELPDWKFTIWQKLGRTFPGWLHSGDSTLVKNYQKVSDVLKGQLSKIAFQLMLEDSRCGGSCWTSTLLEGKFGILATAKDSGGNTLLMVASDYDNYRAAKYLIHHGVNVNDTNESGATALHIASSTVDTELIKYIAERADVNHTDNKGWTPLMVVASNGFWPAIPSLLDAGANIEAQTPTGDTSVLLAAAGRDIGLLVIEELVSRGAKIDHANERGCTALMIAASNGEYTIVNGLIRLGADFTKKSKKGDTALDMATSDRVLSCLRGAWLQKICLDGNHTAEKFQLIEELVAQGADVKQEPGGEISAWEYAKKTANNRLRSILLRKPSRGKRPASFAEWPSSVDPSLESKLFCEMIDFHIIQGKEQRSHYPHPLTVAELIYVHQSPCTLDKSMPMGSCRKGSEASFRWIHLPASNLTWVKDMITRIALEEPSVHDPYDINSAPDTDDILGHHDDGNASHARWRRYYDLFNSDDPVGPRAPIAIALKKSFNKVLDKLITGETWKGRIDYYNESRSLPFLKPQSAFVRRLPERIPPIGDSAFIFMPYLHFEFFNLISEKDGRPNRSRRRAEVDMRRTTKQLVRRYSSLRYPLHPRRTLDQFYYDPLDTKKRDSDQVVYRYVRDVLKEPCLKRFMVDQMWIWILDGGRTVLSSFPGYWAIGDEWRNSKQTDVLTSIMEKLNSADRPQICSPYELAALICTQCFGTFFDSSRGLTEEMNFIRFFERSIGNVSNQQTELFHDLKQAMEGMNSIIDGSVVVEQTYNLLDISREVDLMLEIKDIRDELKIISLIFDDQVMAVEGMLDLIDSGDLRDTLPFSKDLGMKVRAPVGWHPPYKNNAHSPGALNEIQTPDMSPRTTTYNFNALLQTLKRHRTAIEKMNQRAGLVYQDIEQLLDLKQKQSSVLEAFFTRRAAEEQSQLLEQARVQTERAGQQGKTFMVFTVVTVIFLPASFMAAFFAIQIDQFPQSANGNGLALPLDYVAGWTLGVTAICVSVISIIGFNINHFSKSAASRLFHVVRQSFLNVPYTLWAALFLPWNLWQKQRSRSKNSPADGYADENVSTTKPSGAEGLSSSVDV